MVWLGDGAKWIWNMAEELAPEAHQILDWAHISGHISDCRKELFKRDKYTGLLWESRAKDLAWSGEIETLLEELEGCLFATQNKNERLAIYDLRGYCKSNAERMNYAVYREAGFPIGSGFVQSAHGHVLQTRMKLSGQHWSIEKAKRMAKLRAAYKTSGPLNFHNAIVDAWEIQKMKASA